MRNHTQANRMMKIKTPLGEDYFLINELHAVEGISRLFEFDVEILHEEKDSWPLREDVDVSKMLGKAVSIDISQGDGSGRMFNGIVCAFSQSSRSNEFGHYWIKVVPAFWIYKQNYQSRIFQQK